MPQEALAWYKRGNTLRELGRYDEAMASFDKAIALQPDYAEAHNNLGNILFNKQRYEEALVNFNTAIACSPDLAIAHYNRGKTLVQLKRYQEALDNCNRAITHKPAYAELYYIRGTALYCLIRYEEALDSFGRAIDYGMRDAEIYLHRGNSLMQLQRNEEALHSYEEAITLSPDYAEAHNNRGSILHHLKRYEEALASFDKAILLDLQSAEIYDNKGKALFELNRYDEAVTSFNKALALNADYSRSYIIRGKALIRLAQFEEALASFDAALALEPNDASLYYQRGCLLHQQLQCYDEALISFDTAMALTPDYADAYTGYANVLVSKGRLSDAELFCRKALIFSPDHTFSFFILAQISKCTADDITQIETLLNTPELGAWDKEYLSMALAKIYDDAGRYDEAFTFYRQGNENSTVMIPIPYNPDDRSLYNQNLITTFSREFLLKPRSFVQSMNSPVLVVGMPRSGTTLVESILSRHPSIATAGELVTLQQSIERIEQILGTQFPQAAQSMTPLTASLIITRYEKRLRRDIDPDVPYVIDKLPFNFLNLGLVAMLFPKARIVHCMRDPMDTCLSNYFQRFTPNLNYSFDLGNIGHYYKEYEKLMEHWRKALPIPMLEVQYEKVVKDTEHEARRMLDFLELPWTNAVLRLRRTRLLSTLPAAGRFANLSIHAPPDDGSTTKSTLGHSSRCWE